MTPPQVSLEAVRRKTGGRVHLVPHVPAKGPVTTLCGKLLEEGSFAASGDAADCVSCVRRSQDQSRVSGAFFASDAGMDLLQLSLDQARQKRPRVAVANSGRAASAPAPTTPPARPTGLKVVRAEPEPIPDQLGELVTRGFRPAHQGVWISPQGVVVKLRRAGKGWRFEELVFEGSVLATRAGDGVRLRAGDVEVAPAADGLEVKVRQA